MQKIINKIEKWAFFKIKKFFLNQSHTNLTSLKSILDFKHYYLYILTAFFIGFFMTIPPVFYEVYFQVFTSFVLNEPQKFFISFALAILNLSKAWTQSQSICSFSGILTL